MLFLLRQTAESRADGGTLEQCKDSSVQVCWEHPKKSWDGEAAALFWKCLCDKAPQLGLDSGKVK